MLLNKKPFTNPADQELQDALRVSRSYDKVELVLEEMDVSPDLLTEIRGLVIKLTGRRKIDETPAAISAEVEILATDLLAKAGKVVLWAEPAGLPLAGDFTEGVEVFQKILSLANPVHRVNEIATSKSRLQAYCDAIRAHDSFVEKSGKAFTDLRVAATALGALEYRLPSKGGCIAFLSQWNGAIAGVEIISPEAWKGLVNAKAIADHELRGLQGEWRARAKQLAEEAVTRLPSDLAAAALPSAEFQETLSTPLQSFLATVDAESELARIAALPDRAARLINELVAAIELEAKRRAPSPDPAKPAQPGITPTKTKPIKRVRVADVVKAVLIEDKEQWDLVRDRLDETVRKELSSGNSVELG